MRQLSSIALAVLTLACTNAPEGAPPDGEDEVGVILVGKADTDELTECHSAAITTWINEGVTYDGLREAGVHHWAAENIVWVRDGDDGEFGTADDVVFTDVAEIDDISWVGPVAIDQLRDAVDMQCDAPPPPPPPTDPSAEAMDVTLARVTFPPDTPAPDTYTYPRADGFGLGGTEFWQKWPEGENPTYSFSVGSDWGRRCMVASALRFETIMADPPAELVRLREESRWSGRFFNWNDDYSMGGGFGGGASLWAWRTGLIKWISRTNDDGSCDLPTLELVVEAANDCLSRGESNGDGEIQGCSAG